MNIFYLHQSPIKSAQMQCDKHCVKMILESAQMLCSAHRVLDGDDNADSIGMYKMAHKNHPSTVWVRENKENYKWLWEHMNALMNEYTLRYKKTHATERLKNALKKYPKNIAQGNFTHPPQCMPDEYKMGDTVEAYRKYYIADKMYMAKWNFTKQPQWIGEYNGDKA